MKQLVDNQERKENSTEGDWSSGMIPVLGTGGPGFNSRIAPFYFVLFIQLFNNATFSLIYSAILAILTYHFLGLYSFKNCKNAKNILSKHLILERFKSKMSHDENFWLNLAFMSTEQFGHLQWYRQAQFILFIKPVNFQQNTLCFEILSFQKGLQC